MEAIQALELHRVLRSAVQKPKGDCCNQATRFVRWSMRVTGIFHHLAKSCFLQRTGDGLFRGRSTTKATAWASCDNVEIGSVFAAKSESVRKTDLVQQIRQTAIGRPDDGSENSHSQEAENYDLSPNISAFERLAPRRQPNLKIVAELQIANCKSRYCPSCPSHSPNLRPARRRRIGLQW